MAPIASKYSLPFLHRISARFVLMAVLVITVSRLTVIAVSPLGPSVDEAQYWLWGQDLQLGYYSKPPLIAWILGGMHALFGQSDFVLRLSGPILHAATSLILWAAGAQLGHATIGRIAALLWLSLPAVALGSFVMSTDSVLLPFWAAGLFFTLAASRHPQHYYRYMAGAGLAIGVASLAKYAGLYFLPCLALFLVFDEGKRTDRLAGFLLFLMMVLVASAPTWIWNLLHEFVTIYHLGENANLQKQSYSVASLGAFLSAQFGVFGPLCFAYLLIALFYRRVFSGPAGRLHAFIWPILMIVSTQAFLSEANANWAVTCMPAAILVIAASIHSLSGTRLVRLLPPAIWVNYGLSIAIGLILALGSFGIFTPKSDPLRRLRGWDMLAGQTHILAEQIEAKTIIAYSRANAALLHWHLADKGYYIALPLPDNARHKGNHYQRSFPATSDMPRPWLGLTETLEQTPDIRADWQGPIDESHVKISQKRQRDVFFWAYR